MGEGQSVALGFYPVHGIDLPCRWCELRKSPRSPKPLFLVGGGSSRLRSNEQSLPEDEHSQALPRERRRLRRVESGDHLG